VCALVIHLRAVGATSPASQLVQIDGYRLIRVGVVIRCRVLAVLMVAVVWRFVSAEVVTRHRNWLAAQRVSVGVTAGAGALDARVVAGAWRKSSGPGLNWHTPAARIVTGTLSRPSGRTSKVMPADVQPGLRLVVCPRRGCDPLRD
jgi:hypothetical protein